jgi:hypothetical protein
MAQRTGPWRAATLALLIGLAEVAGAIMLTAGFSDPAAAQFFRERRGGFFDSLFGPRRYGPVERVPRIDGSPTQNTGTPLLLRAAIVSSMRLV